MEPYDECCLSVLNKELHTMISNADYSKRNRRYKGILIPLTVDNINIQIVLTAGCNTKTKTDGILSHYIQYRRYKIYPSTKSKTVSLLKKTILTVELDAQNPFKMDEVADEVTDTPHFAAAKVRGITKRTGNGSDEPKDAYNNI